MTSADAFVDNTLALLATYLVHSTLLLSSCWLLLRLIGDGRHELANRLWKSAAIAGLITTAVQWYGFEATRIHFRIAASHVVSQPGSTEPAAAEPSLHPGVVISGPWRTRVFTHPVMMGEPGSRHASASSTGRWRDRSDDREKEGVSPEAAARDQSGPLPTASNGIRAARLLKRSMVAAVFIMAILGVANLLRHAIGFARSLNRAESVRGGRSRRIVDRLVKRQRVRSIRVLQSGDFQQPVAFGCWRPTILLPADLESRLTDDELTAVLSHEVAHLVRRDVWWLWIGKILAACLACQPLNLLARRRWQASSEYLCDQWAVEHGVSRLSLAKCLTKIASWQIEGAARVALPASGSRSAVVGRVSRLVGNDPIDPTWSKGKRACFSALVTGMAMTIALTAPTFRVAGASSRNQPSARNRPLIQDVTKIAAELDSLNRDMDKAVRLLGQHPSQNPELTSATRALQEQTSLLQQRFEIMERELKKELSQ